MIKKIRFSDEFSLAFKRLEMWYRSLPNGLKRMSAQTTKPNKATWT